MFGPIPGALRWVALTGLFAALAAVAIPSVGAQSLITSAIVNSNHYDPTLSHNIPNLSVTMAGQQSDANFLDFYNQNGGLTRWGFPTSEVFEETANTLSQYYQRGVVDWKPSPGGGPHSLQRRLAWDFIGGGKGGAPDLGVEPGLTNPNPGDLHGPWGHKVSNTSLDGISIGFKDFFDSLGGVTSFGFPKTDARSDLHPQAVLTVPGSNPNFVRQYFQAAVLEHHPGSSNPVKIGLIGDTLRNTLYPNNSWQPISAFQLALPLLPGQPLFAVAPPNGDYGDAPDGTSTGYPTQFAQTGEFPTLFSSGGAHTLSVSGATLGPTASVEIDANDPADSDGVANLAPSNTDSDDGITEMVMVLSSIPPPATLTVKVDGGTGGSYFLNVLIDLNMDGKWGGSGAGEESEWVVQNHAVSVAAGESLDVQTPNFAFANGNRLPDGAWMRIALTSEQVVSLDWDGSGVFASGEIEDHVVSLPPGKGLAPVVDCNGPYMFGPAKAPIPWACVITNLGPDPGVVDWTLTRLSGGVTIPPPLAGAPALAAAGAPGAVVVVAGVANHGATPSTWRMRVVPVDPPSVVTTAGVEVGFGDATDDFDFTADTCQIYVSGIETSAQHFAGNSDAIFSVTLNASTPKLAESALVTGTVMGPLGIFDIQGTTDADGFTELRHNTTVFGNYTLNITNIAASGCDYVPDQNVTSSATAVLE